MKSNCCPICQSDASIVLYSLRVVLDNWATALFAGAAITVAGQLLHTGVKGILMFAALAIAPFVMKLVPKRECLKCHIQYGLRLK